MCNIVKVTFKDKVLTSFIDSDTELSGCYFHIYTFDFASGTYCAEPTMRLGIDQVYMLDAVGSYRISCEVKGKSKIRCEVVNSDGEVLCAKESFVGTPYVVTIKSQLDERGKLYIVRSDISLSKTTIYYKAPGSSTEISLPDHLTAGEPLAFLIRDKSFLPEFRVNSAISDCIKIDK